MRKLLMVLLLGVAAGCQAKQEIQVGVTPQQARSLKLKLTGGIAASKGGLIYLTTPQGLKQYDPERNGFKEALRKPQPGIRDVAVTRDDAVLVLLPNTLQAYASGYFLQVARFPGEASLISCDREFAYVRTRVENTDRLLRYGLSDQRQRTLLVTPDGIDALCAVRGGCLVACAGKVYKVTDPEAVSSQNGEEETAVVLLFAVPQRITSMAMDQERKILYFADDTTTYAWVQGQVLPLFPAGGRLAWRNDCLTICHPAHGQIVQMSGVSGRVATLTAALAKPHQ